VHPVGSHCTDLNNHRSLTSVCDDPQINTKFMNRFLFNLLLGTCQQMICILRSSPLFTTGCQLTHNFSMTSDQKT